jgi:hypothetical protein
MLSVFAKPTPSVTQTPTVTPTQTLLPEQLILLSCCTGLNYIIFYFSGNNPNLNVGETWYVEQQTGLPDGCYQVTSSSSRPTFVGQWNGQVSGQGGAESPYGDCRECTEAHPCPEVTPTGELNLKYTGLLFCPTNGGISEVFMLTVATVAPAVELKSARSRVPVAPATLLLK